jgi:hypothetical protein
MMHAVAVGYDWLYQAPSSVLSAADRAVIADGLATRGLQIAADNWKNSEFSVAQVLHILLHWHVDLVLV